MEAMVAGAILAVAITTIIGQLTTARTDLTRAAFRDVAVGLAHTKVSELEANTARAAFGWTGWATLGAAYPNMEWRWRLRNANGVETATLVNAPGDPPASLTTNLYSLEAEVTYPVRHASMDDMADGLADGLATVAVTRVVR